MKKWNMQNLVFLILLGSGLIATLDVCESWGQKFDDGKPMLAEGYSDYFLKNVDAYAYKKVKDVNHFHLKPAMKWIKAGKPGEAIPDLQFILRHVPNHPMGLTLMASVCQMIQRPKRVLIFFQQAIHLFPNHGLTYAQYGKYLFDLKSNEKAKEYLNKAIKLDSKLGVAYGWLAQVYYSEGENDLAKKTADKAKSLGYKGRLSKG
jgi:Tfp pilus assembly protein PilF